MIVWEVEWRLKGHHKESELRATEASAAELITKLNEAADFIGAVWESAPVYYQRGVVP